MLKDQFLLNPEITFLNHGSFGACPKPVFADYQKWQLMLEQEPIQFITKTGAKFLDASKQALADFVNCNKEDLIYTTNPSTALNTVIKSLNLKAGDEILTTDQEYGAMDRTWNYYCRKVGAKYIHQNITLPLTTKEKFLEEFWSGLTPNTKIIFISQITSPTALIFPVKEIIERAKELGLMTIIDGAHAPAHIPLDIKALDPDVYTGACHKWLLAPKGSSFLYVKKNWQDTIDPLIISWGYEAEFPSESQFQDYHQYQGTRDFSAFLCTPAAIQFLKDNNWEERKKTCRDLLKHYYPIVANELESHIICPLTDEFLGQICSIPIHTEKPLELKELLYEKHKIEIPIVSFSGDTYLRISFQAYNGAAEIETLINAIRDIKKETTLLL
ncbi:MAG: isopenicillin-N epimerase [Crocinitomix sp.]|jgi:isopenicillin-N epimerase